MNISNVKKKIEDKRDEIHNKLFELNTNLINSISDMEIKVKIHSDEFHKILDDCVDNIVKDMKSSKTEKKDFLESILGESYKLKSKAEYICKETDPKVKYTMERLNKAQKSLNSLLDEIEHRKIFDTFKANGMEITLVSNMYKCHYQNKRS